MCVIVYKPKGIQMPSNDIIQACARANRDGFGFCTPNKFFKSVKFGEFRRELAEVTTDESCIMHFRFATHGSVCKANCHPFAKDGIYFAHNGILDVRSYNGKTDSETAFLNSLYPVIESFGLDSDELDLAVSEIIGYSKFAIMQGEEVRLFGNYLTNKGCYYSNFRFAHYLYEVPRYNYT